MHHPREREPDEHRDHGGAHRHHDPGDGGLADPDLLSEEAFTDQSPRRRSGSVGSGDGNHQPRQHCPADRESAEHQVRAVSRHVDAALIIRIRRGDDEHEAAECQCGSEKTEEVADDVRGRGERTGERVAAFEVAGVSTGERIDRDTHQSHGEGRAENHGRPDACRVGPRCSFGLRCTVGGGHHFLLARRAPASTTFRWSDVVASLRPRVAGPAARASAGGPGHTQVNRGLSHCRAGWSLEMRRHTHVLGGQ